MEPHSSRSWHNRWKADWRTRTFEHDSGLTIGLDPDTEPLAWRFVLKRELPAGFILNIGLMRRLTNEALRLWQARAWMGQYLREPVLPKAHATPTELAHFNRLSEAELTPDKLGALYAQWESARQSSL